MNYKIKLLFLQGLKLKQDIIIGTIFIFKPNISDVSFGNWGNCLEL
jgi:hypothetical protein